jgi:hypothetical protein
MAACPMPSIYSFRRRCQHFGSGLERPDPGGWHPVWAAVPLT